RIWLSRTPSYGPQSLLPGLVCTTGERPVQHFLVPGHARSSVNTPSTNRICVDRSRRDLTGRAETFPPDRRGESHLFVQFAQGSLDRHQLRLHLDDEQQRRIRVRAEQVDRSALSVARIRHLWDCRPAALLEEKRGH